MESLRVDEHRAVDAVRRLSCGPSYRMTKWLKSWLSATVGTGSWDRFQRSSNVLGHYWSWPIFQVYKCIQRIYTYLSIHSHLQKGIDPNNFSLSPTLSLPDGLAPSAPKLHCRCRNVPSPLATPVHNPRKFAMEVAWKSVKWENIAQDTTVAQLV